MARKPGKTYRTSSGKSIDFGALLLANETAPAIGNMNVNARGDEIDPSGNITKSREDIMREYNELNTMIPSDDDIPEGAGITADDNWQDWQPPKTVGEPAPIQPIIPPPPPPPPPVLNPTIEPTPTPVVEPPNPTIQKNPSIGLAAAVAAAKEVEDKIVEPQITKE